MKQLRTLIKNLPTLLTAIVFAIAVWVFAVNQADPTETRTYPRSLELEIIGIDSGLMIVNDITEQIALTIRAPASILNQLENNTSLISVSLDLSGLESGVHTLTPQVNLGLMPAEVVRMNPSTIFVKLDTLVSETLPIQLRMIGNPQIGFEVQTPELSQESVLVSGPQSVVESIDQMLAEVSIVDVSEDVQRTVDVVPYDAEGNELEGLTISPDSIQVNIPVVQRGGYRTVVVKIVTSGQIAPGYRLTNIFSMPPTVTIFSSDPNLVEAIPGFVETTPINLNGADADLEIRVALNLPEGINVVGSQNVTVEIGIDPIESSVSFTNIPIQTQGLDTGFQALISPETVDVFLSGPLNLLEDLSPASIVVVINLDDRGLGTYQLVPEVVLENADINVDAILPNTVEVTIVEVEEGQGGEGPPTPTLTPTVTP
jgi:YbbR domain-containing protein